MTNSRSAYLKVFPLVFLLALVIISLQLYREYHLTELKTQLNLFEWVLFIFQLSSIWVAVGLAFKKWKAALIALGVAVAITFAGNLLSKSGIMKDAPEAVRYLYSFLINIYFTPVLVFALLCFGQKGIPFFLPFILFSSAFIIIQVGSYYLETSPYNVWYFLFGVHRLLEVPMEGRYFHALNLFKFTANTGIITCTFIVIGEAYTAAMNPQKWKQFLHIDLSTNYTKAGAITLFYSLRLLINIMVIGLLTFPLSFSRSGSRLYFHDMSVLTVILAIITGIALMVFIIRYYRKFLVEYFIAHNQNTSWLFWLVNIPVLGMLIFPLVTLSFSQKTTEEERTRFFYNKAIYAPRAWWLIGVITLIGFFVLGFSPKHMVHETQWLLWGLEVCLLIWLAADMSGYYAMVVLAIISFIVFYNHQPRTDLGTITWYTVLFNIVNLIILLPIFHLYKMKTIQEPPTYIEENEDVGIPAEEA